MEQRLIPYEATLNFAKGRLLVLAPHPDDEVFGCGGAIMRQMGAGGIVHVIILTDGAYLKAPEYGAIRRTESLAAGGALGYGEPEFWGLADRGLEYGEGLIQRLLDVINGFKPTLIFAPSLHEMHPDHRVLGMAALEATRRSAPETGLVMFEVGVPMPRPNILLDISDLVERKASAMSCFESQLAGQAYDTQIEGLNRFRSYTLGPTVSAAEAYLVIEHSQLSNRPLELFESEYQRQRSMGLAMLPSDVPLVSVIIPNANNPSLQWALDSVAVQTYPHAEVIVAHVTSDSPHRIGSWCGRFPLLYAPTSETLNRAETMNLYIRNAQGKYLLFLEADDTLLPDHLEKLVRALSKDRARGAYTGVRWVTEHGDGQFAEDATWSEHRLSASNFLALNAVMFERSLADEGCQFHDAPQALMYWDFWLQIVSKTPLIHVPNISAIPRTAPSNESAPNQTQPTASGNERQYLLLEVEQLRAQAEHWKQAASTQAEQLQALTATISAYVSSSSWKLTSPLRWIARLFQ